MGEDRGREETGAEQPGMGVAALGGQLDEPGIELFGQHREGRQRREQPRGTAFHQQAAAGDGDDQQHAEAAAHAAAGMHQQRQRDDVDEDEAIDLPRKARPAGMEGDDRQQAGQRIRQAGDLEQAGVALAERRWRFAGEAQQCKQPCKRKPVVVQKGQLAPGPVGDPHLPLSECGRRRYGRGRSMIDDGRGRGAPQLLIRTKGFRV